MEYCASLIFWWQNILLIIIFSFIIIINGKTFLLLRRTSEYVREVTGLLHRILLGPDDREGPRTGPLYRGPQVPAFTRELQTISEEER
uniref:V4 n=1 Tax=Euphorbia caput-medusae latent virus TaxID=1853865 RepID=A0A161HDK7_9GEMI|nr:V4 [Euphorbia caput-medusae latent virus]